MPQIATLSFSMMENSYWLCFNISLIIVCRFRSREEIESIGLLISFICVIKVALLRNIILIILFEFSQISWYFERETMGFNDELKTALKKKIRDVVSNYGKSAGCIY